MAHKKKTSYKGAAKKLKELGFIDYDLRRNFSSGQKSAITKLAKQYSQLLSKPEKFVVQKAPKGTKGQLKTAGFTVNKAGNAIIPLHEFDSATITRGQVQLRSKTRDQDIYLAGTSNFFRKLKELDQAGKNLPRNQMITVQIDDHAAFSTRFPTYAKLVQYLTNFAPNDPEETRAKIFARMSLVTVKDDAYAALDKPQRKSTRSKRNGHPKRGK